MPNGPNAKAGTTTCLQCRIRENVLGADVLEGKDVSLEGLQRLCADKLNQWRTNIQRFGMELTEEMEDKGKSRRSRYCSSSEMNVNASLH